MATIFGSGIPGPGAVTPPRYGGNTPSVIDVATKGTKGLLESLGIPSFSDFFKGGATNFGPGFQGMPTLEDLGPLTRPTRADFAPTGNRGALPGQRDLNAARQGFEHPTQTSAFRDLMSLASTRTASANEDQLAQDRAAAMRRGYSGGMEANEAQNQRARMKALAAEGFAGADQVRQEELARYTPALEAVTAAARQREAADTEAAQAYGKSISDYNSAATAREEERNAAKLKLAELPAEYIKTFTDMSGGLGGLGSLFSSMLKGAEWDQAKPNGPFYVDQRTGQRRYLEGLNPAAGML